MAHVINTNNNNINKQTLDLFSSNSLGSHIIHT